MKEKLLNLLIMLPFIWLFSGLLFLKNGDKLMVVLILISIAATLFSYGLYSIKKNMHDKGLWVVMALAVYAIFSYYYHGSSSREIRALLGAILFLLAFPRKLITKNVLKWLVFLGSIIIFFSTYYFSASLHITRSQWPINAIPHGTMGSVITILALTLLLNATNNRDRIILSLSAFMAVGAVVINQTRGIWLALIVATVFILILKVKAKHINWKYALIITVILFVGLYAAKPKIQERINQTQSEIAQIKSGNFTTSIGTRLQLWKAAPKVIAMKPILGSGHGHKAILNSLALQGDIPANLITYSHYHNQYLDRLVKGGIVGLVLFLAILAYPLVVSSSAISQQASIGIVTIYAIASLTDVPFNHGSSIFMYLLLIFSLKLKNDEANG